MDRDAYFDALVARLDPSLVVVTARHGDARDGCVVGFHSQVSIQPRRYGVWLSVANRTYRVARHAEALAVHVLGANDHRLAEQFGGRTGDEVDPFVGVDIADGPHGTVLVADLPTRFVGRIEQQVETGGDHVLFALEPVDVALGPDAPTLPLSAASDIHAGHPAD